MTLPDPFEQEMGKGAHASAQSPTVSAVKQCRRKMEGMAASLVNIVKEVIKRCSVLDSLENEIGPARDGDKPRPDGENRTLFKKKGLQIMAHVASDLEEYA